jgi:hypothetical protein
MSRTAWFSMQATSTFLLEEPDAELVRMECAGFAAATMDCTLSPFAKGGGA